MRLLIGVICEPARHRRDRGGGDHLGGPFQRGGGSGDHVHGVQWHDFTRRRLRLGLGADLGTAINPVLEGATGPDPAAKRLPLGDLVNRFLGVAVALAVLPYMGYSRFPGSSRTMSRAVADFHTAFSIFRQWFFPGPAAFRSAAGAVDAIAYRCSRSRCSCLDPSAQKNSCGRAGGRVREALRMTDVVEGMLSGLKDALERPIAARSARPGGKDDVYNKLNTAIKRISQGLTQKI